MKKLLVALLLVSYQVNSEVLVSEIPSAEVITGDITDRAIISSRFPYGNPNYVETPIVHYNSVQPPPEYYPLPEYYKTIAKQPKPAPSPEPPSHQNKLYYPEMNNKPYEEN